LTVPVPTGDRAGARGTRSGVSSRLRWHVGAV